MANPECRTTFPCGRSSRPGPNRGEPVIGVSSPNGYIMSYGLSQVCPSSGSGTVVRRAARDRPERVQELVGGGCAQRNARACLHVHDREPEAGRVASSLAADVELHRPVVVHEVLRVAGAESAHHQRGGDRTETGIDRGQLRARLRQLDEGQIELRAARERREIVPECPSWVLPSPPRVDRLRIGLHQASVGSDPVRAVRRNRIHPVHRIPGDRVRCEVGLGRCAAPGRRRPRRCAIAARDDEMMPSLLACELVNRPAGVDLAPSAVGLRPRDRARASRPAAPFPAVSGLQCSRQPLSFRAQG